MVTAAPAAADRFPSLRMGWQWITCVCGKRLGTQNRPVTVSPDPSVHAHLALSCRACKREVFLTVR